MKRAILYIIMLATTCVTVYFTMVWEPVVNGGIDFINDKANEKEISVNNIDKNKENVKDDKKVSKVDKKETDEKKVNDKKEIVINEEKAQPTVASVSLLKMDINEIVDDISFVDKTKLVKIGYKLQNIDRKRIEEWVMESESQIEGAKNAYNLLKSRLSSEDFKELQEIIKPYVNIELLE